MNGFGEIKNSFSLFFSSIRMMHAVYCTYLYIRVSPALFKLLLFTCIRLI